MPSARAGFRGTRAPKPAPRPADKDAKGKAKAKGKTKVSSGAKPKPAAARKRKAPGAGADSDADVFKPPPYTRAEKAHLNAALTEIDVALNVSAYDADSSSRAAAVPVELNVCILWDDLATFSFKPFALCGACMARKMCAADRGPVPLSVVRQNVF